MQHKEALETLSEIKTMMEKSSRFQAISGVSIIIVGLYACIASFIVGCELFLFDFASSVPHYPDAVVLNTTHLIKIAVLIAIALFILSFATVTVMSYFKAKRHQLRFVIDKRMRQMVFNFMLPLCVGGLLCLALIFQGHYGLTSSIMLIFYGLALINCQHYTYPALRFLGYGEILLGLIDCFSIHHALLFWFLGFGILHIIFGIFYTIKYDRKNDIRSQRS